MAVRTGKAGSPGTRIVESPSQREFVRGALEMAILILIDAGPTYGYALVASLRESTDGMLGAKEGTVYPLLHRLEDGGYVTASWEAEGRAAPRKYYAITRAGRRRLAGLSAEWDRLVKGMARLREGSGR